MATGRDGDARIVPRSAEPDTARGAEPILVRLLEDRLVEGLEDARSDAPRSSRPSGSCTGPGPSWRRPSLPCPPRRRSRRSSDRSPLRRRRRSRRRPGSLRRPGGTGRRSRTRGSVGDPEGAGSAGGSRPHSRVPRTDERCRGRDRYGRRASRRATGPPPRTAATTRRARAPARPACGLGPRAGSRSRTRSRGRGRARAGRREPSPAPSAPAGRVGSATVPRTSGRSRRCCWRPRARGGVRWPYARPCRTDRGRGALRTRPRSARRARSRRRCCSRRPVAPPRRWRRPAPIASRARRPWPPRPRQGPATGRAPRPRAPGLVRPPLGRVRLPRGPSPPPPGPSRRARGRAAPRRACAARASQPGRSSHLLSRILSTVDRGPLGDSLWGANLCVGRGRKVGSAPSDRHRDTEHRALSIELGVGEQALDQRSTRRPSRETVEPVGRPVERAGGVDLEEQAVIVGQRSDLDPVIGHALLDRLRARLGRD